MTPSPAVFRLSAGVQSYDWGKHGASSKVAQWAAHAVSPGFKVAEDKPYAEVRR
jgi:mannose-6-phosphate isomerase